MEITLTAEIEQIYQGRYEALRHEVAIGVEAAERGALLESDVVFRHLQERINQKRKAL